ncbi:phosphoenolpyruvate carboxykinase (ATP) [Clostridium sp. AF19-22AC]|jgi:phosphoenolpyruvate carboxykinase (ATP)|uniref:phosphoenolpyruvate carboxykinase (ATP) n=1 Tax=Faecalicatena orotica TaxID=1544 RepID=A0A2Y9BK62_9FIRM|nr:MULTISPECIES: phosphoenolpyruvate carboxykinase (ATP) [Clostridia]PWJ28312.1 phosphoenolpyruvate carboxykinase (ATP) [Faecalicatena orotica]RHR27083.1 phosphoenolpyruvate carboxykinase (ATP) [Clostridium sp. AF19-22AC]SSA56767.1 phosphoenolpyruvate carboxykinase (ATP) [Faecalicatena orotica]
MSTKAYYPISEIGKGKPGFSKTRSIIEAAFYGNNVVPVNTLKEAYNLAKNSPGTIVTDMPVYRGEEFGLDADAKVLLFNDGAITGRYAAARRIAGEPGVDCEKLDKVAMDAIYSARYKKLYHATVYAGLDPEFMVKVHLLIPEGEENIMYSWMLNFQYMSDDYVKMYRDSVAVGEGKEPDIYIFSDPQWAPVSHPGVDYSCLSDPQTLCYFNTDTNCACILGMRYFGEHKKGTLTMVWAIANRNGYASCHGGQKEYTLADGSKYVASVYGLSGSGKSTITHAKHDGKYEIKVLHDDAFIINTDTCASIAIEPTYFDKTQDYPTGCEDNKYLLTAQNCSATLDEDGKIQLVTEDIRNGNGRAIKSKLWSPNRVDKIDAPVNAIFWIMKDPTIPPVVKLKGSSLASVMGATLATKRSTAERLAPGVDPNKLVVVPYANPFRTYPLVNDYEKFKKLVEEKNVDCYIINTGDFMGKKVQPKDTLGILEAIVEKKAEFHQWGPISDIEIMDWEGFVPDMNDPEYVGQLKARMNDRVNEIKAFETAKEGYDKLPEDALAAIQKVVDELN